MRFFDSETNNRPYGCNGWVITAQVLTIFACTVSWVWWVTFIISIVGMAAFQILWCCRNGKAMIYGFAVIAGVCSLAEVGVAIFALVVFSKARGCEAFSMEFYGMDRRELFHDDILYPYYYWDAYCEYVTWVVVAFISAALWAASAICMFVFAWSGQHALLEEKHAKKAGGEAILEAGPSAEEGGEPAIETVVPVSETKKVDLND